MALRMMKISVFFFLVGVLMGMGMSMTENYSLAPVHVHLNLLGWVSLAIGGMMYRLFPDAERSIWGKFHFWSHVIGVPAMMIGLSLAILVGQEKIGAAGFVVPLGGTLIVIGTVCFLVNALKHFR